MARLRGIPLIAIAAACAVALGWLYWAQQRAQDEGTRAVAARTGALEERVESGEERARGLEAQAADTQQRTARLERDAREREAQVARLAGDVRQSQEGSQHLAQRLAKIEQAALSPAQLALAQDFATASALKVGVTEYFMTQGRWPENNAAVGLPAPEQYRGDALRSATVLPAGVIELRFVRPGAPGSASVRLVADAENSAMGVRWRCESPDYAEIGRVLAACTYSGQ